MITPSSDTHEISSRISASLADLHEQTSAFAVSQGITCKSGCGACCQKANGVWASIAEMLPLAFKHHFEGTADVLCDQLRSHADVDQCLLFRATDANNGLGSCGAYEFRPAVCRLFGSAARRSKENHAELLLCKWQRELLSKVKVQEIEQRLSHKMSDADTPWSDDWAIKLQSIAPNPMLHELHPINEALRRALEVVWLVQPSFLMSTPDKPSAIAAISNGMSTIGP